MKVQKYEISRTIDKLKSIVQKNDQFPALGGVLVKDGYLIASNTEMTMQLKLEASKGSCFIIPMKAFDVIKNLPEGEVDVDAELFVKMVKRLARGFGFKLCDRIKFEDPETGKKYV